MAIWWLVVSLESVVLSVASFRRYVGTGISLLTTCSADISCERTSGVGFDIIIDMTTLSFVLYVGLTRTVFVVSRETVEARSLWVNANSNEGRGRPEISF